MGSSERMSEEERFCWVMGHPIGLLVLFFVELWERFSFYGMRALLILYMTHELMFGDALSYGIYGAYGAQTGDHAGGGVDGSRPLRDDIRP